MGDSYSLRIYLISEIVFMKSKRICLIRGLSNLYRFMKIAVGHHDYFPQARKPARRNALDPSTYSLSAPRLSTHMEQGSIVLSMYPAPRDGQNHLVDRR